MPWDAEMKKHKAIKKALPELKDLKREGRLGGRAGEYPHQKSKLLSNASHLKRFSSSEQNDSP